MKHPAYVLFLVSLLALLGLGIWLTVLGVSLPQTPDFVSPFGAPM